MNEYINYDNVRFIPFFMLITSINGESFVNFWQFVLTVTLVKPNAFLEHGFLLDNVLGKNGDLVSLNGLISKILFNPWGGWNL